MPGLSVLLIIILLKVFSMDQCVDCVFQLCVYVHAAALSGIKTRSKTGNSEGHDLSSLKCGSLPLTNGQSDTVDREIQQQMKLR